MKINKHKYVATLATVLLSFPMVSLAADNQEKDQHGAGQRNEQQQQGKPQQQGSPQQQARPPQQANPQQQSRPQPQVRPQQQANPQQQSRPQQQANPQPQMRPQQQANPQQQNRPQQQANPQAQVSPQQQVNPQQQKQPQQQASPQQQFRPQQQAGPAGSRPAVATRHVQQSNQWQSARSNWNGNTVWQRNPNWWRGNASFRNYTGARVNFFFAPGFGYYSVPQEYWGRSWNAGAYLPLFFLRYVVNDYQAYGLPPPPYGCRWVWVNTSVLLVDMSDGYILDEIDNVW